jgi:hypothetical protein
MWGIIIVDVILGIHLFQTEQYIIGVTYTLSAVGIGIALSCGLYIPLDPSVEWELVGINQLTLVRTAKGGKQYENVITDYRKAEEIAAAWLRRFGYSDAHVTPDRPDNGIDVQSRGAVAQVKNWRSKRVGIADVQRLAGSAEPGQACFFFSANRYTRASYRWAANPDHRVCLFIMQPHGHIVACNYRAKRALWKAPFHMPVSWRPPVSRRSVILDIFSCAVFCVGFALFGWATVDIAMRTKIDVVAISFLAGISLTMLFGCVSMFARPLGNLISDMAHGRRLDVWKAFTPVPDTRDKDLPPDAFVGYGRDRVRSIMIFAADINMRFRVLRRLARARGH